MMYFKLVNSIDPQKDEDRPDVGGVGLINVIKRLELLYKDKYRLRTKSQEDVFVVDLEITLEKLEEQYAKMELSYSR